MSRLFIPDYYTNNLLNVDWLAFKSMGIKHIFLDIDNTIEPQGTYQAGDRTKEITSAIADAGLDLSVLSNAGTERAQVFCEPLGLNYLGQAAKPLTNKVSKHMRDLNLNKEEVLIVGDQVFTDLWCGRFLGAPVLLVESLGGKEEGFLKFKRHLESFLVRLGQDPKKAPKAPNLS